MPAVAEIAAFGMPWILLKNLKMRKTCGQNGRNLLSPIHAVKTRAVYFAKKGEKGDSPQHHRGTILISNTNDSSVARSMNAPSNWRQALGGIRKIHCATVAHPLS